MRYVCSYCHTGFEAEPAPLLVCPNCKAEAGLEWVVPGEWPPAVRYFGLFLLITAIIAVGTVLAGVTS
jgi:hypothetical protein